MGAIAPKPVQFLKACTNSVMALCEARARLTSDAQKKVFTILVSPVGFLNFVAQLVRLRFGDNKQTAFKDELSLALIAKNEAPYLKEYVEYYKLIGVTRIYFYDNDSSDNTRAILSSYIQSGLVIYEQIHGRARQVDAYNRAIRQCRYQSRYLMVLDADEFLMPERQEDDVLAIVNQLMSATARGGVGSIGVNWLIYGSGGLESIASRSDLLMESFLYRADDSFTANQHVKTICNPRTVFAFSSPHFPIHFPGFYQVNDVGKRFYGPAVENDHSKLRINHYYCKTREEFSEKLKKGAGDTIRSRKTWRGFVDHDRNEVFDPAALKYVNAIRVSSVDASDLVEISDGCKSLGWNSQS